MTLRTSQNLTARLEPYGKGLCLEFGPTMRACGQRETPIKIFIADLANLAKPSRKLGARWQRPLLEIFVHLASLRRVRDPIKKQELFL